MIKHRTKPVLNDSMRKKNSSTMESVYEGWLTKSPRNKKGLLGLFATWQHWRHRYFVLFATSSKVVLNYYEDEKLQKRKGTIDLEHCEEIVDSVESSYYRYIFLLRTTHRRHQRTYYLAAEGEDQLKSWVEYLRSALNLHEDKNFFNKVQLGLQLSSTRNSVLGHTNQNGVRLSQIQNLKEASESLDDAQTRIDSDGSAEKKLGLANRNYYNPESQITMEVGSLSDASSSDGFRFFIAGGSTFYSKADLGKVNKSPAGLAPGSELKSTVPIIETVNGTEESNFSSNESIECEMLTVDDDAAKRSSSTKSSHSRISGTAIVDKCRPPESPHPFPDTRNSGEAISANRLSTLAAVDTSLSENVADFQGSSSPKLHYYEYSLEEMEMIIFDDSQELEDLEGEEEAKNGIGAESNEPYNRIFFSLSRTNDEKRENKGTLTRSRSAASANRNYLCLTRGSRRYRRQCNTKTQEVL